MLYLVAFHTKHPIQRNDLDKILSKFEHYPVSQFCYLLASEMHPSEIFSLFDKVRALSPFYVFSLSKPFDGEGDFYEGYNADITSLKNWISEHI